MSDAEIMQLTIVLAVAIVVVGVAVSIIINRRDQKKKRVQSVVTGHIEAANGPSEKQIEAARRAEISKKLQEASESGAGKSSSKVTLAQRIGQAGLTISVKQFWINSIIFGTIFGVIVLLTSMNMMAKGFLIFVGYFGLPRFYLRRRSAKRQKKFMEDFADALEAMIRLLQAGMPVSEAVQMVGREYSGPVGEEMLNIYEDQKVGIPLGDAADRAVARMPITEMKMFATAVQIQAETGSSLSEVLGNLASVIRARFRLKRKVKALSSEAKASAGIIGALPLLVTGGLYAVNPDYISVLFTDPTGKMMLLGCIFWMSIGVFVMKMMINFKV